jgi:hypothetical protein
VTTAGGGRYRWLVGPLLTAIAASACASWEPQGFVPGVVIQEEHPKEVRVVRVDSSRVVVRAPRVEGDTLRGLVARTPALVPLSDIAYLEIRRANRGPMYAAVALGSVAAIVGLLAATWGD